MKTLNPFHAHRAIADKYTGDMCRIYTLEGTKEGIITSRLNEHAIVKALDGTISMAVSWLVVERKMAGDKLFYAC